MLDAIPLHQRPNLEQYKPLAKDLQHIRISGSPDDILIWATRWITALAKLPGVETSLNLHSDASRTIQQIEQHWRKFEEVNERKARCVLADAQLFLAREHGFTSWPKSKRNR